MKNGFLVLFTFKTNKSYVVVLSFRTNKKVRPPYETRLKLVYGRQFGNTENMILNNTTTSYIPTGRPPLDGEISAKFCG